MDIFSEGASTIGFEDIKAFLRKDYVEVEPTKKGSKIAISAVLTVIVTAVRYYMNHPPVNIHSKEFWYFIIGIAITYAAAIFITSVFIGRNREYTKFAAKHSFKVSGIIVAICILVLAIGGIISSVFFNARRYANIITVNEGNFTEDVAEIDRRCAAQISDAADHVSEDEILCAVQRQVSCP